MRLCMSMRRIAALPVVALALPLLAEPALAADGAESWTDAELRVFASDRVDGRGCRSRAGLAGKRSRSRMGFRWSFSSGHSVRGAYQYERIRVGATWRPVHALYSEWSFALGARDVISR